MPFNFEYLLLCSPTQNEFSGKQTAHRGMKHGRLFITCQSANNIRGRINDLNENLTPHLLFQLNGTVRVSKAGLRVGHDLSFGDEVLSFDLSAPEDLELVIELRNDTWGESVGSATCSIADVLKSDQEACNTLEVLRPGDKTTDSTLSLKFAFVQAKIGVIKIRPCTQTWSKATHAVISTKDGQSKNLDKSKGGQASGLWIDPTNWFGDFTLQIYKDNECIGRGKLSLLGCLDGMNEIENVTSYVPIEADDNFQQAQDVAVDHWFLEAGFVQVHTITASNLRDVSIHSTGNANPRIIIKSHGKFHSTRIMTDAAVQLGPIVFRWNDDDDIRLPIVDEFSLTIGCCEYDDATTDQVPIGSAEISLLPLFKTGHLDTSFSLMQLTEVRRCAVIQCY